MATGITYQVQTDRGENVSNSRTGEFASFDEALADRDAARQIRPDIRINIVKLVDGREVRFTHVPRDGYFGLAICGFSDLREGDARTNASDVTCPECLTVDARPYLNPNNGERTSFSHAESMWKPRAEDAQNAPLPAERAPLTDEEFLAERRFGVRRGIIVCAECQAATEAWIRDAGGNASYRVDNMRDRHARHLERKAMEAPAPLTPPVNWEDALMGDHVASRPLIEQAPVAVDAATQSAIDMEDALMLSEADLFKSGDIQPNETAEAIDASETARMLEADLDFLPNTTRLAIRHYFPNGGILGDGFLHAGVLHPQPIATWNPTEARKYLASVRAHNPRETFELVLAAGIPTTGVEYPSRTLTGDAIVANWEAELNGAHLSFGLVGAGDPCYCEQGHNHMTIEKIESLHSIPAIDVTPTLSASGARMIAERTGEIEVDLVHGREPGDVLVLAYPVLLASENSEHVVVAVRTVRGVLGYDTRPIDRPVAISRWIEASAFHTP